MSASPAQPVNDVTLVGRIAATREFVLPSGDVAVSFRVVVDRPTRERGRSGRVRVDALECMAYRARVRRLAMSIAEGTVVEITGSLRRRFWRTGAAPASRIDVEVSTLRRA